MSIPTSFIDQLLDQTDIVDVVGRRIPLNKKGSNFWCQCPFHDDSNPPWLSIKINSFFIVLYVKNLEMLSTLLDAMKI